MIIFIISSLYYFINIIHFSYGLLKLRQKDRNNLKSSISIIVAAYNGEKSLLILLPQLANQIYDHIIEFVIVDDESTDKTKEIIKKFAAQDPRFIYVSSVDGNEIFSYKKKALDAGIAKAKNDILLFTDVDCQVGPHWAQTMANEFYNDLYQEIIEMDNQH